MCRLSLLNLSSLGILLNRSSASLASQRRNRELFRMRDECCCCCSSVFCLWLPSLSSLTTMTWKRPQSKDECVKRGSTAHPNKRYLRVQQISASFKIVWAATDGGVTNGGLRGVCSPFLEIGRNPSFSPFLCLFRPFPEGPNSTWPCQKTEEKGLFPQISSDLPKPPSLKPHLRHSKLYKGFFSSPSGCGRLHQNSWTSAPRSVFLCGPSDRENYLTPGILA